MLLADRCSGCVRCIAVRPACSASGGCLPRGSAGDGGSTSPPAPVTGGSLFSWLGRFRPGLTPGASARRPLALVVRPGFFFTQHRVHSVLARDLKVRVPAFVPPVCQDTPHSRLMSAAVGDFVAAGALRPGRPLACYRLFAVPESATVAKLVYDLSVLTPRLPCRPCSLPSVESAL